MPDPSSQANPFVPNSLLAVTPDFFEEDQANKIDNIVPTRGYQMMPMVGLGGSAGSIVALQEFFKAMAANDEHSCLMQKLAWTIIGTNNSNNC
jgi:hypothetical protein